MTILPKKKPVPAPDGDGDSGPDAGPERGADAGPERGPGGVGESVGPGGVGGPRPRASPPPPLRGWAGLPAAGSPPPAGPGGPVGGGPVTGDGPGSLLGLEAAALGLPEPRGPGSGGGGGGPGHSKRRRRGGAGPSGGPGGGGPGCGGPGGMGLGLGMGPGGSPGPDEAGGGYNSEDEYEAGRVEMDPATAEQQEHRFEKALREKKGFIIKRMKEDGACLFRAVADQVYGDQDMHEVVRKHCMDYLMKNADYFSNYVTEDFTTYINRKRKSTCHGNHIEMQAMAEMYNRPVEVYQYGTEPINTFHGIQHNEDEPIRVSYHPQHSLQLCRQPEQGHHRRGAGAALLQAGAGRAVADEKRHQDLGGILDRAADAGGQEAGRRTGRPPTRPSRSRWPVSPTSSGCVTRRSRPGSPARPAPHAARPRRRRPAAWRNGAGAHPGPAAPHPHLSTLVCTPRRPAPSPPRPVPLQRANLPRPVPQGPAASWGRVGAGPPHRWCPCTLRWSAAPSCSRCPPTAFGLNDWEDDEILASVLAVSQQEYLETMKTSRHRDPTADKS
ncbi:unnamed protein product [Bubo scandiacus]